MKWLIPEWKMVSTKSYTALAFYALVAVTFLPDMIYYFTGVDTNPRVWSVLQVIICISGLLGRLVNQPESNKWRRRGIITILVLVATCLAVPAVASEPTESDFDRAAFDLISKWEGEENHAYQDIVGVWTICYGHTRTVKPGMYKTDEQCATLLKAEIREYREGLHAYLTEDTKMRRLPYTRDAAYTSLAFNVGIKGAGRSTAARRLNKGNIRGGCEALTWWNRAGGRVVRGLVRRRSAEREYCLIGVG